MHFVALKDIEVRDRQRKEIDPTKLNELESSILSVGLLHPPACWWDIDATKWVLMVGETRLRAVQNIAKKNLVFKHASEDVPPGNIPINPINYLDEMGRFEAELDENLRRDDLPWQDKCEALSKLHVMRRKENPSQTFMDTGKEVMDKIGITHPRAALRTVSEAVIVAEHLSDPTISQARTQNEALQLIYKKQEEKAIAALAKRGLITSRDPNGTPLEVRNGDLTLIMPGLETSTVDLIIADPPYGIGAGGAGFRARTVHHHNYEDTVENAQLLAQTILTEGFRVCKPRANILIFCDIELFDWLKDVASNMAWVPFKRPLIWRKSESEGMAPWGGSGPRITTEFIFYATKGQRGMVTSPIDVFDVKRVPRNERLHAAEKPVELLRQLIACTTLPGDLVLDPCCGSGSALVACKESGRRGLGIEKDPDYYNTALANISRNKDGP